MNGVIYRLVLLGLFIYAPIVLGVQQMDFTPPIELSTQLPELGGAYKSKIEGVDNGKLVVVYGDFIENDPLKYVYDTKSSAERPARDVFVTSCDAVASDCSIASNWSTPINLSGTAQLSSMQTDWNGDGNRTSYYGDSDNSHMFSSGNHVVVSWGDKYCPGGQQRSVTYLEFDSREIPMSCVYVAHATNNFAQLTDWTVDRLSDGSRDVKQDNNKGLSNGVWAVVWQEDPLGLQPGEAEGPGEGSSGAKTSHGTDIWYSYTSNVATSTSDIGVWSTPVRITNNQTGFGLSGSFNPIRNTAGNSVDPSQIDKGIAGASRANLQIVGGSSPPNTVIAYEETKGSAGLDEGKFLRYHVFPYNNPPASANDKAGCIISDTDQNARRARFVAQTNAASGSGIRFAIFWRQGYYTQGGPADIMMRIGYQSTDPGSTGLNPADLDPPVDANCFALDYASAVNLTSASPLNISSNTLAATDANLGDATDTDFLENARAHRAVLRANDLYVGYIYTEDGVVAAATDLANYNFYVRHFNASKGVWGKPENLSNITNTAINVLEPRLMGMPGNQPGCTDPDNITNPENCQNKNVVIAAWGTETNVYEHIGGSHNLDIYFTRTRDKAVHWEPVTNMASGPNIQGESQMRVTPDGNRVFAVWNETRSDGLTNGMFRLGTPVTLFSDMAISASSIPSAVYAGTNIDIRYEVENLGPDRAYDINLIVDLPASVQFLSADDFCTHDIGTVICQLGDMDVNNSVPVELSLQTTVVEQLTFYASIESDVLDDPVANNNQLQSIVNATDASDLVVIVSSSVQSVDMGDSATLVYRVNNSGPSQAENVHLALPLPAGTAYLNAAPDICSELGGVVNCDIGTLANGDDSTVSINIQINQAGLSMFNASVAALQVDPETNNNVAEIGVTGIPNADLMLQLSSSHNDPTEGDHITISAIVNNQGPQAASNVQLTAVIPSGWEQSSLTISRGSCRIDGQSFVCDVGDLQPGESSVLEMLGTVDGPVGVTFSATTTANEQDPDSTNNAVSLRVRFDDAKDTIQEKFGCTLTQNMGSANVFDPTLLIVILLALGGIVGRANRNT
ncbi:choice-of-anchor O protein [Kaarinaea lacus]